MPENVRHTGSHLEGCHRRFIRAPDGSVSFDRGMPEFDSSAFVPVEVKAGSLVLLHGSNVHLRWAGALAAVGMDVLLACQLAGGANGRAAPHSGKMLLPSPPTYHAQCCPGAVAAHCCSKENSSPHSRHAYSMHFVEGGPGFTWVADNWLQRRPDLPFEPLFDRAGAAAAGAGAGLASAGSNGGSSEGPHYTSHTATAAAAIQVT